MTKRKIILSSVLGVLFLGSSLQAGAQEVVTAVTDTVTYVVPVTAPVVAPRSSSEQSDAVERSVWEAIRSTEGYDSLPGDALLPITREQAEKLITQLILEARKPYVEAAYRDSVLHSFKIETLKRRALDQALARTYTDPYERRLDQMERLLYALLLTKGDLSPEVINQLLGGNGMPGSSYFVPQGVAQSTLPAATQGTVPATALKESKELTPDEAIALQSGLNNKEIDLYMSVAYFAFDSSALTSETKETLDNVVAWMKENDLRVSLRGYASPEGKMSYNNKLSGRRVNAVADYIISKGIPSARLEVIPSGIDSMKDTRSKYPKGRRVEIRPILY